MGDLTTIYTGVKFTSLPKQYQTDEYKKFYDKDGNGWLDTKNKNGQNEVALFEQGVGIKLDKYTTSRAVNYSRVHEEHSVDIGPNGKAVHHQVVDNVWSRDKGETTQTDTLFNKAGKPVVVNRYHHTPNAHSRFSYGHMSVYESKLVTKGENNIIRNREYEYYPSVTMGYQYKDYVADGTLPSDVKETKKYGKKTDTYTLNGKQVQAKPIGKGRYEVTDSDGNVSYISHDGKKLKADYVRKTM